MKRFFAILAVLSALLSAHPAPAQAGLEDEVLKELNLARTKPQVYKKLLEQRRPRYRGRRYRLADGVSLMTKEGVPAVDEAIRFLARQRPLPPLAPSEGLSEAARDLVLAEGPGGEVGHEVKGLGVTERLRRHGEWADAFGEDISYGPDDAREVVSELIIDDGVRGRGHRKNIFSPAFRVAGVACGPHARFGTMCAIDFAGGFKER
jgi:uncharacterized protein YkwD